MIMIKRIWNSNKQIVSILLFLSFIIISFVPTVAVAIIDEANRNLYSPLGSRPDEVDLYGNNVWRDDSDVPAHTDLGFRVTTNAKLTIYPGVTVEFDLGRQLLVEGTLFLIGSSERPVNLTARNSTPSAGDWSGVRFTSTGSGFLNYSNITYCTIGISLVGADNIHIANSTINDVLAGIQLEGNADSNMIDNNEVYNCDSGISIFGSEDNIIRENIVFNSKVTSFSMGVYANNNKIVENEVFNGTGRGISLSGGANNNTFSSNDIYRHGDNGIRINMVKDCIFINNKIYSNQKNGILIYSGGDNNIFRYNDISQNTLTGMIFVDILAGEVIENDILNNGAGISFQNTVEVHFENNTISSSIVDIVLEQLSEIDSINNSFNSSKVSVYDLSLLNIYWYMFLETRDDSNSITNAEVNITNASSGVIVPDTMIDGYLDWILCLGSIYTSYGQNTSMNPYWVAADNGTKYLKMGFDMSGGNKKCIVQFKYYPPPVSTLPEDIKFKEDTTLILNISHYFTSVEELDYSIEVLSGDDLAYSYEEDTTMFSAKPPLNWNGVEGLGITATANLGGKISKVTTLTVTAENDPPDIIDLIPNQFATEGDMPWKLNLSNYADDPDLVYGDALRWSVSGVNSSLVNITISDDGTELTFTLKEDASGDDELNVIVKDNDGVVDTQSIWINITAVNDAPSLNVKQVFPTTGSLSTIFNYSVGYLDLDGDLPNYIEVRVDDRISYSMLETDTSDKNVIDGKDYFYATTLNAGSHFFWFDCFDGVDGYNKSVKLQGPLVTIPDKGSIRGRIIDKGSEAAIENANISVFSMDNTSMKFYSDSDSGGNYSLLNLEPGWYQIFATADGYNDSTVYKRMIIKGQISILDISLEKSPVEIIDTPISAVWITINRTNITQDQAVDFIGHAVDLDGDALIFTWDFSDGSEQKIGEIISHTFFKNGTFNVTLTVTDTDGNDAFVTETINVTPSYYPYPPNGNGIPNGNDKPSSSDTQNDLILPIILVILLIVIIITMVLIYMQLRRRAAEEEMQREAEAAAESRRRHREAADRRRRQRELDFVDQEKRDVEQVNLLIADLHSRKGAGKGKGKGKGKNTGSTEKPPRPPRPPRPRKPGSGKGGKRKKD
jgi:parallel beta-helix repeat protein